VNPRGLGPLLDELAGFVRRYVVLSEAQTAAVTLWILHTHTFAAAEATPYIAITSAEPESGKTRLLEVLERLVARPLTTSNISDAALFRSISTRQPTLLFDEIDAIFGPKARDREDMRGLLNAGYRRGAPALRMGGPNKTTLEEFEVFCPKAMAGIGDPLPPTLKSRSITIRLKKRAPGERVEPFRMKESREEAAPFATALAEWADGAVDALADARPALPPELGDRAADVWEPLVAIADLAGEEWAARAREAAVELSTRVGEEQSLGVLLLASCKAAFDANGDRIATADLISILASDEEAPWADWRRSGNPISPRALANLLRPYGIRTTTVNLGESRLKGVKREDFEDAWARYLALEPLPALHPASEAGLSPVSKRYQDGQVTDRKEAANPHGSDDVTEVTAETRGDAVRDPGNHPVPPIDEGLEDERREYLAEVGL
jgi:hypothetical protein